MCKFRDVFVTETPLCPRLNPCTPQELCSTASGITSVRRPVPTSMHARPPCAAGVLYNLAHPAHPVLPLKDVQEPGGCMPPYPRSLQFEEHLGDTWHPWAQFELECLASVSIQWPKACGEAGRGQRHTCLGSLRTCRATF